MATATRTGFGQVEPNQVIGIITAQFIDTIPVDSKLGNYIEQGRFVKRTAAGTLSVPAESDDCFGPWLYVYNEEHFYDERDGYHKDYAMKAEDFVDGVMVPRTILPVLLDIMTTNTFLADGADIPESKKAVTSLGFDTADLTVGKTYFSIGDNGYLKVGAATDEGPVYVVNKVYTMPDSQVGIKLQCVKAE